MLDIALLREIAVWMFLIIGALFCLVGSVGMLRFPDVFARMHAASIIDTVGIGFIFLGLMFQSGGTLISVKLFIVLILMFFAGPLSTHALARAALYAGVEPRLSKKEIPPSK